MSSGDDLIDPTASVGLIQNESFDAIDEKNNRLCCTTVGFFNVLWMGFCFLALFSGFNSVQALQSGTQRNDYGFIGLGVLYGVFSLATLVSSTIVRGTGQRIGLVLGASTYALYIGMLLILIMVPDLKDELYQVLYYCASAIIGFGAAILWTSQGSLLTVMSSEHNLGMFNGVFWALFMCNYLVGGLITQFVLNSVSETVLYIVFSSLAAAAVVALLVIRPTRQTAFCSHQRSAAAADAHHSRFSLLETFRLLFDKRILLLWPAIAYSGLSNAFINVIYTSYIGKTWVGYALICYGCAEVIGSFAGGKLSDTIGRSPVFLASCVFTATGVIFAAWSLPEQTSGSQIWFYFVSYFFLGLGDSGFNTQVQAAVGHFHRDRSEGAFASYRCVISVFSAAGAISGKWIMLLPSPWRVLMPAIVLWSTLFICMFCWVYLDWFVCEVSPKKDM